MRLKERERKREPCIDRVEISRIIAQGVCGGVSMEHDYVTFSNVMFG